LGPFLIAHNIGANRCSAVILANEW
jgi:hypothetical protein